VQRMQEIGENIEAKLDCNLVNLETHGDLEMLVSSLEMLVSSWEM